MQISQARAVSAIAFGALSLALATDAALAVPAYNIIDLGHVTSSGAASGTGVSANGKFASGYATASAGYQAVQYNATTATTSFLPAVGGHPYAYGRGVNSNGAVAGYAATTFFGSSPVPVLWQGGTATQLALPAGETVGRAYAINDSGVSVGSVNGDIFETATIFGTASSTRIATTTPAGGRLVTAYGVSNNGLVVGQAVDPDNAAAYQSFIYNINTDTASVIPPTTGNNSGIAFAISSSGQFVTGTSSINGGSGNVAYVWSQSGGAVVIPNPDGAETAIGRGVNSSGEVVGVGSGLYAVAFLYDGSQTYTLQSLITDPTWDLNTNTFSGGFGISDDGVIVGQGVHNGVISAFMMVPVPEPTSLGLIGLAGATMLRRRRIRD